MSKKNELLKNISWIMIGNIVHAVFQFLLNIYLCRKISTDLNGLLNYAISLISFFSCICALGFNGIITIKFSEDSDNAGEYICTAIMARVFVGMISIIILQIIIWPQNDKLLSLITLCQSLSLLFSPIDMFIYWLRYDMKAKNAAIFRLQAFFVSMAVRVVSLAVYNSLIGYIMGTVFETFLYGVFLYKFYICNSYPQLKFSWIALRNMLKRSYPFVFSALMVTIYGHTDKLMLKSMISNTAVANYSVSATIVSLLSVVASALIEGMRSSVMQQKMKNEEAYKKQIKRLYSSVFWLCIAYGLFITIFSKQMLIVLYGNKYINASPVLVVLVWYSAFSYFGSINNMHLVAGGKEKLIPIKTGIGTVLNVFLNLTFIPHFGAVGAAIASLMTQIFTNFIINFLIPELKDINSLIIEAILLKDVL